MWENTRITDPPVPSVETRSEHLVARLARLTGRGSSRYSHKTQRLLLAVAFSVFAVAGVLAWSRLPDAHLRPRWNVLVTAGLAGTMMVLALNGLEYAVSARLVRCRVTFPAALRVSVLSSAANLLPIPGSVLVRTHALAGLGATYAHAMSSTLMVGLVWAGTTAVAVGTFEVLGAAPAVGWALIVGGVGVLGGVYRRVGRRIGPGEARAALFRLVAVETATLAVSSIRLSAVLYGLGFDISPAQAVAIAGTAVIASATGIFPGGMGIRELLAGGVSPLVGLTAPVGIAGTAIERLFDLAVLAIAAIAFAILRPPAPPTSSTALPAAPEHCPLPDRMMR